MVSELQAAKTSAAAQTIFIAEFGEVTERYFDPGKSYEGALYKWSPEAMKSFLELAGFNARFDLHGVKTAYMDICRGEGYAVLEIERNIKPLESGVRFAADRWKIVDAGKNAEAVRSYNRTEYHARSADAAFLSAIAEQLGANIQPLYIRFSFKECVYAILVEASQADALPGGALCSFQYVAQESQQPGTAGGAGENDEHYDHSGADMMTQQPETFATEAAQEAQAETPAVETPTAPVAVQEPAEAPAAVETPAESVTIAVSVPAPAAASPQVEPPVPAEPTAPTSFQPESPAPAAEEAPKRPPVASMTPMAVTAANAHSAKKSTKEFYTEPAPRVADINSRQRPTQSTGANARSSDYAQGQPKYDTYSKSEVDHMLKQQAEHILSNLSGKVASQQRAFQEAVASQEKTFNKLTDTFLSQVEANRVKLEQTTKNSQDSTKAELAEFHKTLSKELENYRTQMNKVIAPVSKALDAKNLAQGNQGGKEKTLAPKAQAAITAAQEKIQKMVTAAVVLSLISAVLSLINLVSHAH